MLSGQDHHLGGKVILHVKQTIIIYKQYTQKDHNNDNIMFNYIIVAFA